MQEQERKPVVNAGNKRPEVDKGEGGRHRHWERGRGFQAKILGIGGVLVIQPSKRLTSAARAALAGFGGLSALRAAVKSGASLALTDHLASVTVAGADCARARLVHHLPRLQHPPVLQCACPAFFYTFEIRKEPRP